MSAVSQLLSEANKAQEPQPSQDLFTKLLKTVSLPTPMLSPHRSTANEQHLKNQRNSPDSSVVTQSFGLNVGDSTQQKTPQLFTQQKQQVSPTTHPSTNSGKASPLPLSLKQPTQPQQPTQSQQPKPTSQNTLPLPLHVTPQKSNSLPLVIPPSPAPSSTISTTTPSVKGVTHNTSTTIATIPNTIPSPKRSDRGLRRSDSRGMPEVSLNHR